MCGCLGRRDSDPVGLGQGVAEVAGYGGSGYVWWCCVGEVAGRVGV